MLYTRSEPLDNMIMSQGKRDLSTIEPNPGPQLYANRACTPRLIRRLVMQPRSRGDRFDSLHFDRSIWHEQISGFWIECARPSEFRRLTVNPVFQCVNWITRRGLSAPPQRFGSWITVLIRDTNKSSLLTR